MQASYQTQPSNQPITEPSLEILAVKEGRVRARAAQVGLVEVVLKEGDLAVGDRTSQALSAVEVTEWDLYALANPEQLVKEVK